MCSSFGSGLNFGMGENTNLTITYWYFSFLLKKLSLKLFFYMDSMLILGRVIGYTHNKMLLILITGWLSDIYE